MGPHPAILPQRSTAGTIPVFESFNPSNKKAL